MADEDLAIAPTEQAAPAIETEQAPPAPEPEMILDPGEVAGPETPAEPPELELVEVEWDDGQKYQIPKAVEGGLLRNKDYTQKTQTLAETRKALETREAQIEERTKATDAEMQERATLVNLDQQLADYAKLTQADWDHHATVNPAETDRAWRAYQLLKERRGEVAKSLEGKVAERTAKAEQDLATRVQETLAYAQKSIPGFKADTIPTLVGFAESQGIPEEAIKRNWSPVFIDLLHKAHIGAMTLQKQATAPKLPPANVKPLTTVNGKASPGSRVDLASADMESYARARREGVGGPALR